MFCFSILGFYIGWSSNEQCLARANHIANNVLKLEQIFHFPRTSTEDYLKNGTVCYDLVCYDLVCYDLPSSRTCYHSGSIHVYQCRFNKFIGNILIALPKDLLFGNFIIIIFSQVDAVFADTYAFSTEERETIGLDWSRGLNINCFLGGNSIMARKDSDFPARWNVGFRKLVNSGRYQKLCEEANAKHGQFSFPLLVIWYLLN